MMKLDGRKAAEAVIAALVEAGLPSPAEAVAVGWVRARELPAFSIRMNVDCSLMWRVAVDVSRLHATEPMDLCRQIRTVMESLGVEVRAVRCVGGRPEFVEYDVISSRPDWIGSSD